MSSHGWDVNVNGGLSPDPSPVGEGSDNGNVKKLMNLFYYIYEKDSFCINVSLRGYSIRTGYLYE